MRRLCYNKNHGSDFMYIYQNTNWPHFRWDKTKILDILAKVKWSQGLLLGKMQHLGFALKDNALLQSLTEEILKSNEIEGNRLDIRQVRSSIARKLGITSEETMPSSRDIDGTVDMMLDAIGHYEAPITKSRLCAWHKQMFPTGKSGWYAIQTGCYRDDKLGPMQVVSGPMGAERVHYQAPAADVLDSEMNKLFKFINEDPLDNLIKAGVAHLWFVILHPFDDGNGRIARALTELLLARSEGSSQRFYSMSSSIEKDRKEYYQQLEITRSEDLDITNWLEWFLNTLHTAINNSDGLLKTTLAKASFWNKHMGENFNERQTKMLNKLFDGFKGHLTSTKWALLCKCSQDTASRDIADLQKRNILAQIGAGRNTHYILCHDK